ncbi:MAG: hypothetical protein AMS16_02965 [Planctomycetes bacterium DG_58]|nr:MAG: hypothetical protein AMS16_02965 [Planctomycetes bacterium DG_58]KPL04368.1 MAG: hypothetical protein AMK75_01160 [Planctomycetes bacterium SM23_65]
MEKVLKLAEKLGQEIRRHERYRLLREAEDKVLADPEAKQIQDDLEKQLQRIRKLEQEMKPIEVADKRELSRLQELAARNPGLKDLLRAQADYFEMMNKVNNTILMALAPSDEEKGDDQSAGVSSS